MSLSRSCGERVRGGWGNKDHNDKLLRLQGPRSVHMRENKYWTGTWEDVWRFSTSCIIPRKPYLYG